MNYRDLITVNGTYGGGKTLVPNSDGAGEIVEIGALVTKRKVGERVAGTFKPGWKDGAPTSDKLTYSLGGNLPGLLSEYALFEEDGVVPLPEHLSYEEAATLPCAALTAWNALTASRPVLPGDTVLIQGTGGVSLFALQFAKLFGARVIATSSSDAKLARYRSLGADEIINYRTEPDWDAAVLRLTNGRGADHIIDVGGAETLGKSINAAAVGAEISIVGFLSGPTASVPLFQLINKMLRFKALSVGSRESFLAMNRAISLHALRPVIDRTFTFDQARDAYKYMESGSHFGKIVISI